MNFALWYKGCGFFAYYVILCHIRIRSTQFITYPEQYRADGPSPLVVIPGVPAFSIPNDNAGVLLNVYRE